jgi:hypothetical protein
MNSTIFKTALIIAVSTLGSVAAQAQGNGGSNPPATGSGANTGAGYHHAMKTHKHTSKPKTEYMRSAAPPAASSK